MFRIGMVIGVVGVAMILATVVLAAALYSAAEARGEDLQTPWAMFTGYGGLAAAVGGFTVAVGAASLKQRSQLR